MTAQEKIIVDEAAASHEDFGDEVVAIDNKTGVFFSLRGRAIPVWRCCCEAMATGDFEQAIGSLESDEQALLRSMITTFKDAGILVAAPADAAVSALPDLSEFGPASFERNEDMDDLIKLDPIHDVDDRGWPHAKG